MQFVAVWRLGGFIAYSVLLFVLFATFTFVRTEIFGFVSLDGTDASLVSRFELTLFFLAAILTPLGIFSKAVFDHFMGADQEGAAFKLRRALAAMLVAPVVIVGIFDQLLQASNLIVAGLICYQNGFFFQTILNRS